MARVAPKRLATRLASGLLLLAVLLACLTSFTDAKKSKLRQAKSKCHQDECNLSPTQFALYSNLKSALDSQFDISGKDLVPLLRSIQILKLRFESSSNATRLVRDLLSNKTLESAIEVFESEDGKSLTDVYRQSVNGRRQNLACSKYRIDEIERATAKLEANAKLAAVFTKIHKNFVRKSAKKCLKHSCTSVDTSMSRLDSVLGKRLNPLSRPHDDIDILAAGSESESLIQAPTNQAREFEAQETELCKFLKKTNESNCQITGTEMAEIKLILEQSGTNETRKNPVEEYMNAYEINNPKVDGQSTGQHILQQCSTFRGILGLNLAAIKWYQRHNLIEDQKMSVRTFWCPGLAYWLQIDRLCEELVAVLDRSSLPMSSDTLTYDVSKRIQIS